MSVDAASNDGARRERMLAVASALVGVRDTKLAAATLCAAIYDVVRCERSYCLFYDARDRTLWAEPPDARECALAGIVGAAVDTGQTVCIPRASDHPAHATSVDDPAGTGRERMLVQPVMGVAGEIHAVLVAVRAPTDGGFGRSAIAAIRELSRYVGPALEQLGHGYDQVDAPDAIFRREAIDEHSGRPRRGDVVRITPSWIMPASWLIAAFAATTVAFIALGSVHRYSRGVAVVRAGNRTAVVTREGGVLASIEVDPGEHVDDGEVLARLDDDEARTEFERIERQFLAQLRARMRVPSDVDNTQAILVLRTQLSEARMQWERRLIVAPHAGTVVDLRSTLAQPLAPGDTLLTMSNVGADFEIVALLPGDDRPQIQPGMQMRFELPGYRHEPQWARIDDVADAVVGPKAAARQLGPELADVVAPPGPSIMVRGSISRPTFRDGGDDYAFHDGMYGAVEVRLRRESLLEALVPGLAEVLR